MMASWAMASPWPIAAAARTYPQGRIEPVIAALQRQAATLRHCERDRPVPVGMPVRGQDAAHALGMQEPAPSTHHRTLPDEFRLRIGPRIHPFDATLRRPAQSLAGQPSEQLLAPPGAANPSV